MLGIFGTGSKKVPKPAEIVKQLKEGCFLLEKNTQKKQAEKISEDICKNIHAMKVTLLGDNENPLNPEAALALVIEVVTQQLIPPLIANLSRLEDSFEAKKALREVFAAMLKKQSANKFPFVEYLQFNSKIIESFATCYETFSEESVTALTLGAILRELIKSENLALMIIKSPLIWKFFDYVDSSSFDVASDAFASFKELLSRHKAPVSQFLLNEHQQFFEHYKKLLNSPNYVTRRQSLKLLGELLLDKSNFKIMTIYISSAENLKLIMNLLRDKKKSLQYEAFHVFKVFVANPDKPPAVQHILVRNKEKILLFLTNFQTDKDEEQFKQEKNFLLKQVEQLPNWQG